MNFDLLRALSIVNGCLRFCSLLALTCLACRGQAQEKKEQASDSKTMSASFVNSMDLLNESHKLGPGDQISFRVIEDEDPPVRLTVTDAGEMEVPYLGRLNTSGKSCKTIAYEIKAALEKQYYFQASVILGLDVIAPRGSVTMSRGKIYVSGQVRSQGPQEIPADEVYTLSKAILHAGGFSDYANKRKVKVTRKATKTAAAVTQTVDLVEDIEKGKTEKDLILEPEDVIFVPERGIVIF